MTTTLLLSLLLVGVEPDPRIQLVELQARHESKIALEQTERLLVEEPEWSAATGVGYLRGHLLDELDRPRAAARAFVEAAQASPSLQHAAFLRIASNQMRLGHPELAAGILVAALGLPSTPRSADEAVRLLVVSLAQGADCGILSRVDSRRLSKDLRRRVAIARIDCDLRAGRRTQAPPTLIELVQENGTDLTAKNAADRLVALDAYPSEAKLRISLGAVFHQHRDFDRAIFFLEPVIVDFGPKLGSRDFDTYYQLARSYFWKDDLVRAIAGYAELAERASRESDRAKALYQLGRSYELSGRWQDASASYRKAYVTERQGDFSGASLISALRVEWRRGHEDLAADILETFPTDRLYRREYSRALLFLASSDIVRGRSSRAAAWLEAARSIGVDPIETAYWSGRLDELRGQPDSAIRNYLETVGADPYHPLAQAAQRHLSEESLAPMARTEARRLASSNRARDLIVSWRVLGHADEDGARARRRLKQKLDNNRAAKAFLTLAPVPASSWPLWQQPHDDPAEKLLALGLWAEAEPMVLKHFPLNDLPLAYTAGLNLAAIGHTNRSLYIAEVLYQRAPSDYPAWLLPYDFRRILYPLAYQDEVAAAARRFEVDPNLMLSVFRQESRFDPTAASPASARGLAQFIYPTAERIGRKIGRWPLALEDLEKPEIAIELSAAYLAELSEVFRDVPHRVAAAYNAGERQARLWQTYCYSWEAEEFYTKVSFGETRSYLDHVLQNRTHYREIYGNWWAGQTN